LKGHLTDHPKTDNADKFSQSDIADPETLERDGAESGRAGVLETHALRNRRDEVLRHTNYFGVVSVTRSGAGDAVSRENPLDSLANLENNPGAAVSQGHRFLEARPDLFERGPQALDPDFLEDFPDLVGAFLGFLEETAFGDLARSAFGAGGNERKSVADKDAAGEANRFRDLDDFQFSGAETLKDLFHAVGRLTDEKGGGQALRRFKEFRSRHPSWS
jgi:hypothetical protein